MLRWLFLYALVTTFAFGQETLLDDTLSLTKTPKAESISIELPLIELKMLILEAKPVEEKEAIPEPLKRFLQLDRLQGFVEIEEEGGEARIEEIVAKVRLARERFIVIQFETTDIEGVYATDIITYDEVSKTYLRWRQLPNKSVARLRGVALNELSALDIDLDRRRLRLGWSGEMKGRGLTQSGSILGAESINGTLIEFNQVVMKGDRVVHRESLSMSESFLDDVASEAAEGPAVSTQRSVFGALADLLAGRENGAAVALEDFQDEAMNFILKHPGRGFTQIPAEQVNKDANLVLMSSKPNVFFMLLAEDVGIRHAIDAEMVVSIAQGHLKNIDPQVSFSTVTSKSFNGMVFQCFDSNADVGAFKARYAHSISVHAGFAYQLVSWCAESSGADPRLAVDQIAEGFRLIREDRVAGESDGLAPPYHDAYFGVQADLTAHMGFLWGNLEEDFPGMHYGVQLGGGFDGAVIVMPVEMRGLEPDLEGLTHACLATVGLESASREGAPTAITQGVASGQELILHQNIYGTPYRCRLRVLVNGETACLLAGWIPEEHVEAFEPTLVKAMDAVQFEAPDSSMPHPELPPHARVARGDLYNEVALSYYNRSNASAAESFSRRAVEIVPENQVYAGNLVEVLRQLGKEGEALRFLEKRAGVEDEPNLLAMHASLLLEDQRYEEAIAIYQTVFSGKHPYRDEEDLLLYMTALVGKGETAESVRVVEAFMKGTDRPSLRVRRWHMQALRENGEFDRASELLIALRKEAPGSTELTDDFINLLLDTDKAEEALIEIAGKVREAETARLRFLEGRAYVLLEDYPQAKESFEKALKLAPNDVAIQQGLDLALAALGQGDQTLIKDRLEPVAIPLALQEAMAAQALRPLESGHHQQQLEAVTGFHFEPGEPLRRTEYRVVKVLNRTGVQEESSLELTFDHVYERIYLHYLDVLDEEGNVVAQGQPSDYYVSGGDASVMATNDRILYAPVPGLQPGYTIKYAYTRQGLGTVDQFPFERFFMVSGTPTAKRAIFVLGRIDQVSFVAANGVPDPTLAEGCLYWLKPNPPLVRFEPQQPPAEDYLPIAALGSREHSWEKVGQDYLHTIQDRLEPSETMVTLAQQVSGEAIEGTDEAKAEAILDWVRRSLSYQAIEFGIRARTPNRGERIVSNRYGDCKDHSLVAYQLLKASGLEAHLTLIHNRSALLPGLPSLNQFNHMILYLPKVHGGRFVDCTSKDQSFELSVPEDLGDRDALVLDPAKPRLVRTAAYDRDVQKIDSLRKVSLSGDADLLIEESAAFHGYYAGWIRRYLRGKPSSSYEKELQRLLGNYAKLEMEKVTAEHLEDLNEPLVMRLTYRLRGAVEYTGGEHRLSLPAIWERYFIEPNYTADRTSPFRIQYPLTFNSKVALALSDEWSVEPESSESNDQAWSNWSVSSADDDSQWELEGRIEMKLGQFPAESYQAYQQDMETALKAISPKLELSRTPE